MTCPECGGATKDWAHDGGSKMCINNHIWHSCRTCGRKALGSGVRRTSVGLGFSCEECASKEQYMTCAACGESKRLHGHVLHDFVVDKAAPVTPREKYYH